MPVSAPESPFVHLRTVKYCGTGISVRPNIVAPVATNHSVTSEVSLLSAFPGDQAVTAGAWQAR